MFKPSLFRARWIVAGLLCASAADATIVERVVAVVGDRPILLSDVRQRTTPFYKNLPTSPSERAAAQSSLFSQMLDKMVEEELIARAAVKAQVQVTREEIDAALDRVAKGNNVEVEDLFAEVEASGINRTQYRNEIRRQLVDAKVVNLRLQGKMRVSEEEVRREYDSLVEQERRQLPLKIAAIRIADSGPASIELARTVLDQARQQADFAALCRAHCTDETLREAGGLLPIAVPSDLPKELAKAAALLDVGHVSSPIKSGNDWVILKVVERDPSTLPPFADAADQLTQRVQLKKMEQARTAWLKTLRKQHHVEIR
jgi:peptidyl-prolyl cis-trans isomerase SurA